MPGSVEHDEQSELFVLRFDDGSEGYLQYRRRNDENALDLLSTYVPEERRGKNYGDRLVLAALEYANENNFKIIPSCPFVPKVLEKYPKYNDLLLKKPASSSSGNRRS